MNSEFNEMERMFAEGLQNYEVTPPAHVWSNIQKRKRKGLLFYKWRIAAAVLLLCVAGTFAYYFIHENNDKTDTANLPKPGEINNSEIDLKTKNDNSRVNLEEILLDGDRTNIISNIPSTLKNQHLDLKENTSSDNNNIRKEEDLTKGVSNEESSIFDTRDLFFSIIPKDKIKLGYIMYPSLMQYIYTSKKLGKKYITPKKADDRNDLAAKYSIELVCGPSYSFRRLSGNGSLLRNESEKANLSIQTGFKVNFHINTKWSLQTGLTLENRNEKLKYNRTETEQKLTETPHQVTIIHPVLPPRTITVIDSHYSEENVTYNFSTTNKYQTINIPLVAGYNFTLGKLQYRFSAGPLFNIYSMNTAYNLVRSNDKIVLTPYRESTKIKTSVYSAVALLYPWNSQYSGVIEISYYNNLTNRLNSDAVTRQRNYGFNVSTGIKINLIK